MSREVRRVSAKWEHPKDAEGRYVPLMDDFPYNAEEIEEGLRDGWLIPVPPNYGCDVMPQWPEAERTHWQMYESVTEGTPISPVVQTPEALAHWLADNKASSGGFSTATYEQWLAMIRRGSSLGSFILNRGTGEMIDGVGAVSKFATPLATKSF